MSVTTGRCRVAALVVVCAALVPSVAAASSRTYTVDLDFDEGSSINVDHDVANQLQLDETITPFSFIWVANSGRGTIVKIDVVSGDVLGEYRSAPEGEPRNPSRTTVDDDGNVWAANRNAAPGSVVHIGLLENGQCEDRNGNGTIETSAGLADIRGWSNAGGVDTAGGVETAADECIIHYTRVAASGTGHVSVTPDDDVWVSGSGGANPFDLVDGDTGTIIRSEAGVGFGGHGGLITSDDVIWSAQPLLRWDTTNPLSGPNGINWEGHLHSSYGLCIDPAGNVWNTALTGDQIRKFAPDGSLLGIFSHGFDFAQGCVADQDGDIWVAHSSLGGGATVGHLKNDGTFVGRVPVGNGPTGVAVDANNKIWVTNYHSQTVMRIDPDAGPRGGAGDTVGAVDLATVGLGGDLDNYSDMTGSILMGPPKEGSWTVVHDAGQAGREWGRITSTSSVPAGAGLSIEAASSDDGVTFSTPEIVTPGADLSVPDGRFLRVTVLFVRAPSGGSPVLHDLAITTNRPPTAIAGAYEIVEGDTVALDAGASTDPDGDALTYEWDINNDGTFESTGVTTPFTGPDGPAVHTVDLRVCDVPEGACNTTTTTVEVRNAAPTVDAGADVFVNRGEPVALSGTFTDPGEAHDDAYTWKWTVESGPTGDGTTSYGDSVGHAVTFATEGTYTAKLAVTDKDGAPGEDELVITVVNRPPDCSNAQPSVASIWPPNHKFVAVDVLGLSDADDDDLALKITSIRQDEPVHTVSDGSTAPDGKGVGTDTAEVRGERAGSGSVPGDGRVYHLGFRAGDGHRGLCTGTVEVEVPHDQSGRPVIDGGPLFDSTQG